MPRYAIAWAKTNTETVASLVHSHASSVARRGRLYDLTVANTATPADALFTHVVRRTTAIEATGAVATTHAPSPLDIADAVALANVYSNTTGDTAGFGTGASLLRMPLNHRATFRWVAAPGGELVWPASTGFGLSGGLTACSTQTFTGMWHYEE